MTGILDDATINQMNRPRCGNKDITTERLWGDIWSRSSLTWSLRSYPDQISEQSTKTIMQKAFNTWTVHIPLKITEACSTCSADFVIEFGRYDHNCEDDPFDGPGATLAHASPPPTGKIHFDADEQWTEKLGDYGVYLYSVAVHEIGHALGLQHNLNRRSIMFPRYDLYERVTTLSNQDRRAIQALYGRLSDPTKKPYKPTTSEPRKSTTESSTTIKWKGNNWAQGCDFKGNDLSHALVPADRCSLKCEETKECTHFAWSNYQDGTCWMKKGSVSKSDAFSTNDQSMICGVVSDDKKHNNNIHWNGDWAYDCDFKENNLMNIRVPADQCGPRCEETKECTHFAWTNDQDGICWMKKGLVSKNDAFATNNQSMICGVTSSNAEHNNNIHWNGNWAHGCDFKGNNLMNVRIRADQCGPRCKNTEGCTHFAWSNYQDGTCWMKTGSISKNDALGKHDQSRVCGVIN